ncbi:hypothetical protein [Paeniglutamicibacter antarcticus]|uniref:Uncharacterized protein n=1 Tax=Paeniglutamicibacter antarcticus TaxID=494023 RepID=A0ABP9TID3_9MICC
MSKRNTFSRTSHDLGLAAWFGGSLMGAIGLNGATAKAKTSQETLRLSSIGWARWTPVAIAAMTTHAVGGVGLIAGNKDRLHRQNEAKTNTVIKLAVTLVASALTAYSGVLGKKIHDNQDEPVKGTTEPASETDPELASAQRQLRYCQWAIPALTGIAIVMGAQQGEQQRPAEQTKGLIKSLSS